MYDSVIRDMTRRPWLIHMRHDSFIWDMTHSNEAHAHLPTPASNPMTVSTDSATPQNHQIQKLRFPDISRYKFKLRFWLNLNLYPWRICTKEVCACVCVSVCVWLSVYTCVCVCIYTYICTSGGGGTISVDPLIVRVCVCVRVCVYIYIYMRIGGGGDHICRLPGCRPCQRWHHESLPSAAGRDKTRGSGVKTEANTTYQYDGRDSL